MFVFTALTSEFFLSKVFVSFPEYSFYFCSRYLQALQKLLHQRWRWLLSLDCCKNVRFAREAKADFGCHIPTECMIPVKGITPELSSCFARYLSWTLKKAWCDGTRAHKEQTIQVLPRCYNNAVRGPKFGRRPILDVLAKSKGVHLHFWSYTGLVESLNWLLEALLVSWKRDPSIVWSSEARY